MPTDSPVLEGVVISEDLAQALEPVHLLRLLKQFGFSDADLADATRTNERTVRRWKADGPSDRAGERLGELRNLVLLFRETEGLTDRGVVLWLRHANRLLEDYTPLQVLGVGGFRAVRQAALCFVNPQRRFDEPLSETLTRALARPPAHKRKAGRARLVAI